MFEPVAFLSTFFSVEQASGIYVVVLNREQLTDDDNLEQFAQDFQLLIEKHEIKRLVIRLNQVRYMTSSAIGRLITLHRKLIRSESLLVLSEPTKDVQTILDTARLLTYFKVRHTLEESLALCAS